MTASEQPPSPSERKRRQAPDAPQATGTPASVWLPAQLTASPAPPLEDRPPEGRAADWRPPGAPAGKDFVTDRETAASSAAARPEKPRPDASRGSGRWRRTAIAALVVGFVIATAAAILLALDRRESRASSPQVATAPAPSPPLVLATLPLHPRYPAAGRLRADARVAMGELAGIQQVGSILGTSTAPAKLTVYADVSSLGFALFDQQVLPTLIAPYVRSGRLTIQLRTLPRRASVPVIPKALDPAYIAQAAGLQTRLWQFVGALSAQNLGYVDSTRTMAAARLVPGLDTERLLTDTSSARVMTAVTRAVAMAKVAGVQSTPAFTIGVGSQTEKFSAPLSGSSFAPALEVAMTRLGA